jgi:hypothetical protein
MIEDLTHEDYLKIATMVPKRYTWAELRCLGEKVSVAFLLHFDDAMGAVLVAASINKGISVLDYEQEKKNRIQEVINLRKKD